MKRQMKHGKKLLSLLVSLSLILGLALPVGAVAAPEDTGLKACHTQHDAKCGYVEAKDEISCDCEATPDEDGNLVHAPECSYVEAVEGHPCEHTCDECSAPAQPSNELPALYTTGTRTNYEPLTIKADGFNVDVVAENNSVLNGTAPIDGTNEGANFAFFSNGYSASGGHSALPADGTLDGFQLASYTGNNALQLKKVDATGTFTFDTIGVYSQLSILATSANGNSTFEVTINYTDGTTSTTSFVCRNWTTVVNNVKDGTTVASLARIKVASHGDRDQTVGTIEDLTEYGGSKLFEFPITIDPNKLVSSIKFKQTAADKAGTADPWTTIMAVSGVLAAGTPARPTSPSFGSGTAEEKNAILQTYPKGFTALWNADATATAYFLDVSENENFTTMVKGYNNLKLTADGTGDTEQYTVNGDGTLSYGVTGLKGDGRFYYRVRALNASGQSASSAPVDVSMENFPVPTPETGSGFHPLTVTGGFNKDVVAESSDKLSSTNPFDGTNAAANWGFYGENISSTGCLPTGGQITATLGGIDHTYQLAGYTQNNALQLTSADPTATLTVSTGAYSQISILGASANGASAFTATLNYTDGTSGDPQRFAADDWYYTGDNRVILAKRVKLVANGTSEPVGMIDGGEDGPALLSFTLEANPDKLLKSITFERVGGNRMSWTNLMAVSGVTLSGIPATTTLPNNAADSAEPGYTGFTAVWNGTENTTYYFDLATDEDFTQLVGGYNNKALTNEYTVADNVASYTVTGLAPGLTYYYRVRTANDSGQSVSSDPVTVTTTASTPPAWLSNTSGGEDPNPGFTFPGAGVTDYNAVWIPTSGEPNETNGTIQLLKDVTLTKTIVPPSNSTITLDLNGKTLTGNSSRAVVAAAAPSTNMALTVLDSSVDGNGQMVAGERQPAVNMANCTSGAVISVRNAVTIDGGDSPAILMVGGDLYVGGDADGTVKTEGATLTGSAGVSDTPTGDSSATGNFIIYEGNTVTAKDQSAGAVIFAMDTSGAEVTYQQTVLTNYGAIQGVVGDEISSEYIAMGYCSGVFIMAPNVTVNNEDGGQILGGDGPEGVSGGAAVVSVFDCAVNNAGVITGGNGGQGTQSASGGNGGGAVGVSLAAALSNPAAIPILTLNNTGTLTGGDGGDGKCPDHGGKGFGLGAEAVVLTVNSGNYTVTGSLADGSTEGTKVKGADGVCSDDGSTGALPSWVAASGLTASNATWDQTTRTLTLTANATLTGSTSLAPIPGQPPMTLDLGSFILTGQDGYSAVVVDDGVGMTITGTGKVTATGTINSTGAIHIKSAGTLTIESGVTVTGAASAPAVSLAGGTLVNKGVLTGGAGEADKSGGAGVQAGTASLTNTGAITGGKGGVPSSASSPAEDGGAGVELTAGATLTLDNTNGAITGGVGGNGQCADHGGGGNGAGGVAVYTTSATLAGDNKNAGTQNKGANGVCPDDADTSKLPSWASDSGFTGKATWDAATRTLKLTGDVQLTGSGIVPKNGTPVTTLDLGGYTLTAAASQPALNITTASTKLVITSNPTGGVVVGGAPAVGNNYVAGAVNIASAGANLTVTAGVTIQGRDGTDSTGTSTGQKATNGAAGVSISTSSTLTNAGVIRGGNSGNEAHSSSGPIGGRGVNVHDGVGGSTDGNAVVVVVNTGAIFGGNGGDNTHVSEYSTGGYGNDGVHFEGCKSQGSKLTNSGLIVGGDGGSGVTGSSGSYGAYVKYAAVENQSGGVIRGGNGGDVTGGTTVITTYKNGGQGLLHSVTSTSGNRVTNAGTIVGGKGGDSVSTEQQGANAIAGGVGLQSNKEVTNTGTITGGNGGNTYHADTTVGTGGLAKANSTTVSGGTTAKGADGQYMTNPKWVVDGFGSNATYDANSKTVTLTGNVPGPVKLPAGTEVTIDLAGHTIGPVTGQPTIQATGEGVKLTVTGDTGAVVGGLGQPAIDFSDATGSTVTVSGGVTVTGGAGSAGVGSVGGAGAPAIDAGGNNVTVDGTASVTGGQGGKGAENCNGGSGGAGVVSTGTITVGENAAIKGGNGGKGGSGGEGGSGGAGSIGSTPTGGGAGNVKPGAGDTAWVEDAFGTASDTTYTYNEETNTVTLNGDMVGPVTIPGGKSVIIDLNGHTLGKADGNDSALKAGGNNVNVTITDSSTGDKGSVVGANGSGNTAGKPAIDFGSTTGGGVTVTGGVNVTGGSGGSSASGNGTNGGAGITASSTTNVTVTDATVTGGNGGSATGSTGNGGTGAAAITTGGNVSVTGTVYGGDGGNGPTAGGNGGNGVTANGTIENTGAILGGAGGDGTADATGKGGNGGVGVSGGTSATVTNNGGTITGGNGGNGGTNGNGTAGAGGAGATVGGTVTGSVTGGNKGEGTIELPQWAKTAGFDNTTAEWNGSDTLKLLDNTTLTQPVAVPDGVTIDLNGKTLTAPDGQSAIVVSSNNVDITITDSATGGKVIGANGGSGNTAGKPAIDFGSTTGGGVTVTGNAAIQGGHGGDNASGNAGNGAPAISATGNTTVVIGDGSHGVTIQGGSGGKATGDTGNGGAGGDGVTTGGNVDIKDKSAVTGGAGGASVGGTGGNGGSGAASTSGIVSNSGTATGGNGGVSTDGTGGSGGTGLYAFAAVPATNSGTATGGKGGSGGTKGGAGGTGAEAGGTLTNTGAITGGNGGNGTGDGAGGWGGNGGLAYGQLTNTTPGTITGGKGGSTTGSGNAGDGGIGALHGGIAEGSDKPAIKGGNGGDATGTGSVGQGGKGTNSSSAGDSTDYGIAGNPGTKFTPYTITFDANGGEVTPASGTTGQGGKLTGALPTPTRAGSYTFDGWYTAASGGDEVTADTVFTADATIYARWTYTGGSGSSSGDTNKPTTTTNPDGSTTTTTTDKTTGAVTETTKHPDGTITEIVTEKNGTVSETVTQPGGIKTETVTKPNGAKTETVTKPDGSSTQTATDKNGKVVSTTVSETAKDGTVTSTVTDSKGDVTTIITKTDSSGTTHQTITDPYGEVTKVDTVTSSNGTVTEKATDSSGGVTTTVTTTDMNTGATTANKTEPDGSKVVTVTQSTGAVTQTQNRTGGVKVEATVTKDGEAKASVSVPETVDGKVKVAIPAGDGNVVILTEADGTQKPLEYSVVENGVAYVLVDKSADIHIEERTGLFADMTGHWAEDAADFAGARQIFQGVGGGNFAPNLDITRGSLVTVLYRMEQTPEADVPTFTDTDPDRYYAGAVAWGAEQGVVKGISDTQYEPDRAVTRQELCTMLFRYAQTCGYDMRTGKTVTFADADTIPDWSKEAMLWAASAGLVAGKPGNLADPTGTATRAETAAILERFITNVVKK